MTMDKSHLGEDDKERSNGAPTSGKSEVVKVKVKEHIVLREIHLRTMGRHLSMGSHSVICHPTEVTFTPTGQVGTQFIDPVRMKG